ncbi:hypothetical protein T484DRAFT_2720613 [Baffinella frigidus]|nr:hypothetical protein T484DRAFT_2720613 [Cryptophyta sp. CCMP2293]
MASNCTRQWLLPLACLSSWHSVSCEALCKLPPPSLPCRQGGAPSGGCCEIHISLLLSSQQPHYARAREAVIDSNQGIHVSALIIRCCCRGTSLTRKRFLGPYSTCRPMPRALTRGGVL